MSKQTAILNHYTKLETLFKIIKADGLHFFATRYDFLNDKSEHNWSYKPLKEEYKRVGFCADKDFDRFYERFPYVISFSKEKDDKSMWKNYADGGKGVVLGLFSECIDSFSVCVNETRLGTSQVSLIYDILYDVEYLNEKVNKNELKQTIDKIAKEFIDKVGFGETDEEILDARICACPFIKEEKWKAEHEIRYIRIKGRGLEFKYNKENPQEPIISTPNDASETKYRQEGDKNIPYIEIVFPCNALRCITISNNEKFIEARQAIYEHINKFDDAYKEVKIISSEVNKL